MRHGPSGYETCEFFRPWLRDEFDYRCVYCLFRERWCPILAFHLDHFVARVLDGSKKLTYQNLLYACPTCNSRKSSQPLPSPLEAFRNKSVSINDDGSIETSTPDAQQLVRVLGLDSAEHNEWRRLMIGIIAMAARSKRGHHRNLFRQLMSYPDDLPDLSRLVPPKNSRPSGIHESAFARRQRSELPEAY